MTFTFNKGFLRNVPPPAKGGKSLLGGQYLKYSALLFSFMRRLDFISFYRSARGRLVFFRRRCRLAGIASHCGESMLSSPRDGCARYEWSGALITPAVRGRGDGAKEREGRLRPHPRSFQTDVKLM